MICTAPLESAQLVCTAATWLARSTMDLRMRPPPSTMHCYVTLEKIILTATRIHADYSLLDTRSIRLKLARLKNMRHSKGYPLRCMQGHALTHGIPSTDHTVVPTYGNQHAGNELSLTAICVSRADSKYSCSYVHLMVICNKA